MFKVYFSKNKTVLKSLLKAFLPLSTQNSIQEVEILKDNQLEKTIDLYQADMNFETAQSRDKSGTKEKSYSTIKSERPKHHRQLYLPLSGKKQTNRIGS